MRRCSIDECQRPHKGHGYCAMHLDRVRSTGDPMVAGPRGRHAHQGGAYRSDPAERLSKYQINHGASECWGWSGKSVTRDGYPTLCDYRTGTPVSVYAHRVSYEVNVGPIPDGYEVDHLCFNTTCTNPGHLEAVTVRVNRLRRQKGRDPLTGRYL